METVTVVIQQGELRGRKTLTKYGSTYFSFQGIPYAKPPLGSLRFQAPLPAESWSGVRDALSEGPIAPQINITTSVFCGNEDCLYLNVYTPQLPKDGKLLPVMVWIHGGAFAMGSGGTDVFGPDYLVAQDVVLVTFNYRLGILGFLSLENEEAPGNAGLKDQVMALKWVQQNISKFGGDPGNVTLFGQSAGAVSVHLHLMSPLSKGLFHRAISQSGTALCPFGYVKNPAERAFRIGEALGCKTNSPQELLAFLCDATPRQLVEVLKNIPKNYKEKRNLFVGPVIDLYVGDKDQVFLPGAPLQLILSGKFHQVPYIVGVNSSEGIVFFSELSSPVEKLEQKFHLSIPDGVNVNEKNILETANTIKKFYFGDKPVTKETLSNYVEYETDVLFFYDINKTVKLHAEKSSAPVYYYNFPFDGKLGLFKRFTKMSFSGAWHSDDVGYLFRVCVRDMDLDLDSAEMIMLNRMVRLWTNFAKHGNPTPVPESLLMNVTWKPATSSDLNYLNLDIKMEMLRDLKKERQEFWDKLYSQSVL